MNIADAIEEHARDRPDAPALIAPGGRVIDYRGADAAMKRIAAKLAREGIAAGSVVGVAFSRRAWHFLVVLALARLGAISIGVHPHTKSERLAALAVAFGLGGVVTDSVIAACPGLRVIRAGAQLISGAPGAAPRHDAAPGDPWCIALTSGSTGVPKAVARSHGEFLRISEMQRPVTQIGPQSRFLCAMTPYTMAVTMRALNHLHAGGALVFPHEEVARTLGYIARHGVTHAFASPAMLSLWLEALPEGLGPFPALTHLLVGGGHFPERQRREVMQRISPNVVVTYGTTETGFAALADASLLERHPGCAGRLLPWIEAQAVDEGHRPLPAGENGVLRFRGEGVATAYYGAAHEGGGARAFRDGWCYPGDFGRVSADGVLHVEERVDDIVSIGGVKVSTTAVERALLSHPAVVEAAAYGMTSPQGEPALAAAVVARGELDEQELLRHYTRHGGRYAWLLRLRVVPSLPRNAMGKVMKKELAR